VAGDLDDGETHAPGTPADEKNVGGAESDLDESGVGGTGRDGQDGRGLRRDPFGSPEHRAGLHDRVTLVGAGELTPYHGVADLEVLDTLAESTHPASPLVTGGCQLMSHLTARLRSNELK
jgi:hypothetical protein